jgi:hypothetical protein
MRPQDIIFEHYKLMSRSMASAVERIFLDPVESAAHQFELLTIKQLQPHVNLVAFHSIKRWFVRSAAALGPGRRMPVPRRFTP